LPAGNPDVSTKLSHKCGQPAGANCGVNRCAKIQPQPLRLISRNTSRAVYDEVVGYDLAELLALLICRFLVDLKDQAQS
jgi:hypothetical protein